MFNITVEQVIDIHTKLIEIFGGLSGIKNKGLLESAILSPQQGYYNDIETIGLIVYGICQNHPFNDGNKRTAFVVGKYLLNEINKKLNITNDEYEKLIRDIATGKYSINQFIKIWRHTIIPNN